MVMIILSRMTSVKTPQPSILIVGDTPDVTALETQRTLGDERAIFFNLDRPELTPITLNLKESSIIWKNNRVSLKNIKTLWLRRTRPYERPFFDKKETHNLISRSKKKEELAITFRQLSRIKHFHQRGVIQFLRSLVLSLPQTTRVVSDIFSIERSNNKWFQLLKAEEVGLKIPRTLITNNGDEIYSFFTMNGSDRIVAKDYGTFVMSLNDQQTLFLGTEFISGEAALCLKGQSLKTPRIFQEYVSGLDARITVIGNKVLGCFLDIKDKKLSRGPDMRRYYDSIVHKPVQRHVLKKLRPKLLEFMKTQGLEISSMDFKFNAEKEEFIFLESNPGGQYVWPEEYIGSKFYPAKKTTIDFLLNKNS